MTLDGGSVVKVSDPGRQNHRAIRVPDHLRTAPDTDGATVLDVHEGQMFRLNLVGSRVLDLLKLGLEEPEIADQLACEFSMERRSIEEDVLEFVKTLEKHNLLRKPKTGSIW